MIYPSSRVKHVAMATGHLDPKATKLTVGTHQRHLLQLLEGNYTSQDGNIQFDLHQKKGCPAQNHPVRSGLKEVKTMIVAPLDDGMDELG